MLLYFFGEKYYDAKLLSGFGEMWKCRGAIGQDFRVGPVHRFSTRTGRRIQSRRDPVMISWESRARSSTFTTFVARRTGIRRGRRQTGPGLRCWEKVGRKPLEVYNLGRIKIFLNWQSLEPKSDGTPKLPSVCKEPQDRIERIISSHNQSCIVLPKCYNLFHC